MWSARASGHRGRAEIKFQSPTGEIVRARGARGHDFGNIEVYIRQLGTGNPHREPGFLARIPTHYRQMTGWLERGDENPRLFRFLELTDPLGRRVLMELAPEAPEELYRQLIDELFDEEAADGKEEVRPRKLQKRPVPQRHHADGPRRQREVRHEGGEALSRGQGVENWLEKHGLLVAR